jgi:hypothetical protein
MVPVGSLRLAEAQLVAPSGGAATYVMHPLFWTGDALPTSRSPFQVRGVFFDQVLKHAASERGGVESLMKELRDERIREFMGQKFRWSEWYEALPMVPVQAALSRLQGGDFERLVRKRSRAAAETLVPRVFRVVLGLGGPKAAATHIPRVLAYYYNFGELALQVDAQHGEALARKIPRFVAASYVNTVVGFIEGGLRLLGAKLIEGGYSEVAADEPVHGFETISCKVALNWIQ